MDPELLKKGFRTFYDRHDFDPLQFTSVRSILAVGLWWHRQETEELVEEDLSVEEVLEEEIEETELTPEDIADKFERHFLRAGQTYARVRKLTALLNSDIDFQLAKTETTYHLIIRNGQIKEKAESPRNSALLAWQSLGIETYDRMSVLQSELQKIKAQHGQFRVQKYSH